MRSLIIRDHKLETENRGYWAAQVVAHGLGHGGYRWYTVQADGELLCAPCVRENWRLILDATKYDYDDGWTVAGLTNSGEMEGEDVCAHCNRMIPEDC